MRYLSTPSSRPGKSFAIAAVAALCIVAATSASAAPTLINGSLDGPTTDNTPPTGWTATTYPGTAVVLTPDTIDKNRNAFGSTSYAPLSASPNGGSWVGLALTDFRPAGIPYVFNEGIQQTVSGFTIGTSYTLTWYHANFGLGSPGCPPGCSGSNAIELLADGASVGSGSVLSIGTEWVEESVSFIAADTDINLTFQSLLTTGYSYQSIDGIRLMETPVTPPNAVPEPAMLSLFSGAGLALVLASRRRKQDKEAAV